MKAEARILLLLLVIVAVVLALTGCQDDELRLKTAQTRHDNMMKVLDIVKTQRGTIASLTETVEIMQNNHSRLRIMISDLQTAHLQKKVWGKGELPQDWQDYFGNDNPARLSYRLSQLIDNQGKALNELRLQIDDLRGPNEVVQ